MNRRRDRSNELIVAIIVIGTLAVALTFGIILTLSSTVDDDTSSETLTAIAQNVSSVSPTFTPSRTPSPTRTPEDENTPIPLPITPTPDAAATSDAIFAVTREALDSMLTQEAADLTATAVNGIEVPTRTPEPTRTATDVPTQAATRTPEPTRTATDVPTQAATRTPEPTRTATDMPTQVPATRTPEPTRTTTPTRIPTQPPSVTPRPTDTPSRTPTRTVTPTPTRTPSPSVTLTFTPYPTLTPSITPFAGDRTTTPKPGGCIVPADWSSYVIQPGNTMFSLARRFNTSVSALADANCLDNPGNITAGQILYVPPGSNVTPEGGITGTVTGSTPAPGSYISLNCDNPAFTITNPRPGTLLRGTFAIYGTATHPDFQFYRLQISGSGTHPADFATLNVFRQPVANGELGTIDTGAFAPGDYWLRLTVVDNTGNYPAECTVQVRFN